MIAHNAGSILGIMQAKYGEAGTSLSKGEAERRKVIRSFVSEKESLLGTSLDHE
jgi:hypothetical protein